MDFVTVNIQAKITRLQGYEFFHDYREKFYEIMFLCEYKLDPGFQLEMEVFSDHTYYFYNLDTVSE